MGKKGYLILENGTIFTGESIGADKNIDGEVVFNTGMTGYPEGFTDPSYSGQILTMTYPLIGNYGVPPMSGSSGIKDFIESDRMQISGLIISTYIDNNSHWQSETSLQKWLLKSGVPALSGIDTRTLTKTLREKGVMKGKIFTGKFPRTPKGGFSFHDVNADNLVDSVSCKDVIKYGRGKMNLLLIDCGLKYSQIKQLLKLKTTITRIPWNLDPFKENIQFDAVLISNGPGDPKMAVDTIAITRKALSMKIPTLGICLGNQILALAAGADTYKLKYGHRGQNQPVKDNITGKCFITTQNHGYSVDLKTLKEGWFPWFTNLNDRTCEGIRHIRLPFFSCQFHPESTPGPTDTEWIFKYFIKNALKWLKQN